MLNGIETKDMKQGDTVLDSDNFSLILYRGENIKHKKYEEFEICHKGDSWKPIDITLLHDMSDTNYNDELDLLEYDIVGVYIDIPTLSEYPDDIDKLIYELQEAKDFANKILDKFHIDMKADLPF